MKRKFQLLALAALLLAPCKTVAGDFSFGLTSHSGNFWGSFVQMPVQMINGVLGLGNGGFSYDWLTVKDPNGKIKVDNGNYFGFKAKDLFNNFGYGLTVGYQPSFSILGIFVSGEYNFRQFKMQPDRTLDGKEKYRLNGWALGAILRLKLFEDNYERIYFAELGTKYNKIANCKKGPFNKDKKQFGDGFSTSFGLGMRFEDPGFSLGLYYTMPLYDYFNRDFTTADGRRPYVDIKSKNHCVGLRLQIEI